MPPSPRHRPARSPGPEHAHRPAPPRTSTASIRGSQDRRKRPIGWTSGRPAAWNDTSKACRRRVRCRAAGSSPGVAAVSSTTAPPLGSATTSRSPWAKPIARRVVPSERDRVSVAPGSRRSCRPAGPSATRPTTSSAHRRAARNGMPPMRRLSSIRPASHASGVTGTSIIAWPSATVTGCQPSMPRPVNSIAGHPAGTANRIEAHPWPG